MRLFTHPRLISAILVLYAQFVTAAARSDEPVVARPSTEQTTLERTKGRSLRASVIMHNGGIQCSATMFAADNRAAGIGDAHCFAGNIGGKFWVSFVDSSHTLATLEAIDRSCDLALFTVDAADVLDVSRIPLKMPAKFHAYESVGYPKGTGPTWQSIDVCRKPVADIKMVGAGPATVMERWCFVPHSGIFGGHSGSGVFADGHLVAVTNGGSVHSLVAAPHKVMVDFIKRHANKLKDCGPLFAEIVEETSNPIAVPVMPSPAPPPEEEIGPPPNWQAKPNTPVEPSDIYPGHGKLPKRLKGIRNRAGLLDASIALNNEQQAEIEQLKAQNAAIQAELEALKNTKVEVPPAVVEPPAPQLEVAPVKSGPNPVVVLVVVLAVATAAAATAFILSLIPVLFAGRMLAFFRGLAGR